jgi:hypothetical protein
MKKESLHLRLLFPTASVFCYKLFSVEISTCPARLLIFTRRSEETTFLDTSGVMAYLHTIEYRQRWKFQTQRFL